MQLLNEEGLPIIDISEPLGSDDTRGSRNSLADEDVLVPLVLLSPSERDQRRLGRDRILDLLEEEERQEQKRSEELASEQRREALQKRKEAAKGEMDKLKAAKEMQKKMGKALLRNMSEAREREDKAQKEIIIQAQETEEQRRMLKPKKSVTFAEPPEESDGGSDMGNHSKMRGHTVNLDWGDVEPARLRATNRPTLVTKTPVERHPMKMVVVERIPGSGPDPEEPAIDERDSDDESTPGSPVPADSDEGDIIHSDGEDHDSNYEEVCLSDTDEDVCEEPVLEDEVDLAFTQHQREIALEYHSKRGTIGKATSKAMTSHSHTEGEDNWNHQVRNELFILIPFIHCIFSYQIYPLEANLSVPHPKPTISHFKASRIASSYNSSSSSSVSTSLATTILPASSTRTLQRAIRTGKLDIDNRLVGGDTGESASEEENEATQEILELLRKGEAYNLGPDGNLLRSSSSNTQTPSLLAESSFSSPTADTASQRVSAKPKTSKFKLARSQAGRPAAVYPSPTNSPRSITPVSNAGRSSPKLPPVAAVIEHHVSPDPRLQLCRSSNSNTSKPSSISLQPSVMESSSDLRPQNTSIPKPGTPSTALKQFSMLVDSPSFPAPTPLAASRQPTTVDLPSFPQDQRPSRRPDRPPTVMSSVLRESIRGAPRGSSAPSEHRKESEAKSERKVSRFLAERM